MHINRKESRKQYQQQGIMKEKSVDRKKKITSQKKYVNRQPFDVLQHNVLFHPQLFKKNLMKTILTKSVVAIWNTHLHTCIYTNTVRMGMSLFQYNLEKADRGIPGLLYSVSNWKSENTDRWKTAFMLERSNANNIQKNKWKSPAGMSYNFISRKTTDWRTVGRTDVVSAPTHTHRLLFSLQMTKNFLLGVFFFLQSFSFNFEK